MHVRTYGNLTVLSVASALDRARRETFRAMASEQIRAGGRWFVVDLAKAPTLDSSGLEDLLWFQEEAEAAGGVVKVAGLKGAVRTIFEMTRFDRRFETYDGVPDAVLSFEQGPSCRI